MPASLKRTGRPAIIPFAVVEQVKALCANPLPFGAQKVIAIEFGMSQQHLSQILRGKRRATG